MLDKNIMNKMFIKKLDLIDILITLPFDYIKSIDIDFISAFEFDSNTGKTIQKISNLKINEPI